MADFLTFAPPGHFYSPLPDQEAVQRTYDAVARTDRDELPGIDLRAGEQLALLAEFAPLAAEFSFPVEPTPTHRYYSGNHFFAEGDARIAFAMLRRTQPRRIVEIGAGFSSALILDTAERHLTRLTDYVCADPDPSRLFSLMRAGDEARLKIVPSTFDALPADLFAQLERDDVLFIDSSHVVKFGSDVASLVFEILPTLAPGVLVHVHDIFWPFEYPREWYAEGRAWNEAHFMRAFLMFNSGFVIEYLNHYVASRHAEALERAIPQCRPNPGGSLWLRRSDHASRVTVAPKAGAGSPIDRKPTIDLHASLDRKLQILLSLKYREALAGTTLPALNEIEFRSYSQNGEDGVSWYIFSLIGVTNRKAVEISAGDGLECNSANLIINHGWTGLLFDGDDARLSDGRQLYARLSDTMVRPPTLAQAWITAENVNHEIASRGFAGEIDLLSIDVDGNDYWIWNAIDCIRPRVVVVEYNAWWGPDRAVTIPYDPQFVLDFSHVPYYGGASLAALVKLGREKGYRLVGCNNSQINAFFIRSDLAPDLLKEVPASDCLSHWVEYDWEGRAWQEV